MSPGTVISNISSIFFMPHRIPRLIEIVGGVGLTLPKIIPALSSLFYAICRTFGPTFTEKKVSRHAGASFFWSCSCYSYAFQWVFLWESRKLLKFQSFIFHSIIVLESEYNLVFCFFWFNYFLFSSLRKLENVILNVSVWKLLLKWHFICNTHLSGKTQINSSLQSANVLAKMVMSCNTVLPENWKILKNVDQSCFKQHKNICCLFRGRSFPWLFPILLFGSCLL